MAGTKEGLSTQTLSLPEELILMLLNEETGYFHQVPGWDLNCAVAGAVLAELSLLARIDTDMESLFLVDRTETGDPALDPILKEIASEPDQRSTQFWIERLAPRAESVIDLTLDRLVELKILKHHDGEFWTLAQTGWQTELYDNPQEGTAGQFIRTRISRAIFMNKIPDPRDVIVICLVNTCDVFRFIFQLDEESEAHIQLICKMDVIGRSIADAVAHNLAGPLLRHSALIKKRPAVPLRKVVFNRHVRTGNIPALFADLAQEYGPVFEIRLPFAKPMIFLAGPGINHWAHRYGRMGLRVRDYIADFEKAYGTGGILPSMDGTDHFRLRKALSPAYSRERLAGQLERGYHHVRKFMADWTVGDSYPATRMCRRMVNAFFSPLSIGVESQDIFDDLTSYKERALVVYVLKALPKFMLQTPKMKRGAKAIDTLLERIQGAHTPAQRAGCPRDLTDDMLSLHASDPQLVPESSLRLALSMTLMPSVYTGDALSFALYAMASQPALYDRIRSEADALFANGDPAVEDLTPAAIDVTHRFLMECLRMYPPIPVSIRDVANSCVVEGYELPVGSRICIAQTAPHYMDDAFPDPFSFDIDRYLPPRNERRGPGYAPYGLGTHRCLGYRWLKLQFAIKHADARTLLHLRGVPRELQVPDQPVSVDETEQETEIPHRRAAARAARLTRPGAASLGSRLPEAPTTTFHKAHCGGLHGHDF